MDPNNVNQPNNNPANPAEQPMQTPPPAQPGYYDPNLSTQPAPQYQQPAPEYPQPQTQDFQYAQTLPPQTYQPNQYTQQLPPLNQAPPPRDVSLQSPLTPPPRPKQYGKLPLPIRIVEWLKGHWWAPIVTILAVVVLADVVYQFTIPMSAMPLGTVVDGVNVGGMTREDATKKLDDMYGKVKVNIFFGDSTVPYKTPTASEVGILVHNSSRLQNVSYPLYLRFIPTSSFWAKDLTSIGKVVYDYDKTTIDKYALKEVGEECYITPKNASLKIDDGRFAVIPAISGGKCDITKFKDVIKQATIGKDGAYIARTDIGKVDAPVTDEIARQLGDELNHYLDKDVAIQAGGKTDKLPAITVKGWLSFKAIVPEEKEDGSTALPARLAYVIEPERVRKYLDGSDIASRVEKQPGVTKVATTDFTETSRVDGNPGVLIDMQKTIASIDTVVMARNSVVIVTTGPVPATVKYERKYTPTEAGYMALIRQFGQDNGEHFGIKFMELSGKKPWLGGEYRVDQPFPAAGVEGLYLAYAAQAGIEDGSIQPTDRIEGGRTVTDCRDDAIKSQDQECIQALLDKISNATVQNRMRQIGLTNTSFSGQTITTTAGDLYKFMYAIEEKLLQIKGYNVFEGAMRDVDMRDGLLKGTDSTSVVNAGGSSGGYNEGAIVSNKGKYIVVVLSNQPDAKLAEKLMRAIDNLHIEKNNLKS